jgi:type VI secretion system secreted protein Hcp
LFAIIAVVGGVLNIGGNDVASIDTAFAANVDYFLKIEGVEGESTDPDHKGYIEIDSWNWGMSRTGGAKEAGRGLPTGKLALQDFNFAKEIDKASPKLFSVCLNGEKIPKVELRLRKAGEVEDYFKIEMTNVLCSSFNQSGSDAGPSEVLSLNFEKIEVAYIGR